MRAGRLYGRTRVRGEWGNYGAVFALGGEGVLCPEPKDKIRWEEGRRCSRAEGGYLEQGKRSVCH